MGWPAQNSKTRNSRFYDIRTAGYLKSHFNEPNKFLIP